METGKTIHGSANLVFDALGNTAQIVEDMHRNIAATPWPLGTAPEGATGGITGAVYGAVKTGIRATRGITSALLAGLAPALDRTAVPGPHREAAIAALNGICGDHLVESSNPLAIPMRLRVFLPPLSPGTDYPAPERTATEDAAPFSGLFETHKRPVEIHPCPDALAEPDFEAGGNILLLLHGLCMNDREWTSAQHNHAEALAQNCGYSPVYALYNSGRNISTNGRDLSGQLSGLLDTWPVPVESITIIGFSMGGLVTRSAMHIAENEGHAWLDKVDKAVYLGTPHHGAALERGGYWLQKSVTYSPYTAPLAALGRIRSAGITDLRHGNIRDDDWQHHDEHSDPRDRREPVALAQGVRHYAIAGTLSRRSGERTGNLRGDGLVHPASAIGSHEDPRFNLAFCEGHTRVIYDVGHLAMLQNPEVLEQLLEWLDRQ
ncbi:MAG: alpha/beta hydrolase [Halioglobus sp.]|nr:alpha/beta hydrolase [Halioglobus sp.]